ncbi:MAG: oxidoreductase molybdopterin binding [Actinomycetia bacterium]|nr:oxidoreductase molybdopterin binding [Actinomycetes bacterium]
MGDTGSPVGRRVFLGLIGLGAVGIAFGAKTQKTLETTVGPILAKDRTGLAALLPIGRFRIYSVTSSMPSRSKQEYKLRVRGLVDHAIDLSYDDLRAMPPTHLTRDFQCVTGWRVFNVKWTGVRLADVLDRAGVKANAHAVRFTSFDGTYTESLTLDQARRNDVIVAYGFEGGDVSRIHGGPVRMYIAPMYGYKSTKWLDTIELTRDVVPGYWEDYGYDVDGWVGRSNGRSDTPT